MHNLELTEDQDMIVDTVRKFVADAVAPAALEEDEHRRCVRGQFDGLGELGLFGLLVAESAGGAGLGFVPYAAALECVGAHSSSLAALWIGHTQCALAAEAAVAALDAMIAGSVLASFAGPEHGLRFAGGRMSGTAALLTGGAVAGQFIAAAVEDGKPVLLAVPGERVQRAELRSLGLASAGCARVGFDGAEATVLASGEAAAHAIARARLAGWIGVAGTAVGGALASIEASRTHAGQRIAFGKPLLVHHAVQRKLVECGHRAEAARHLTWHAARLADSGQDAVDAAMHARIAAVDAMVLSADEAIQIHGGYGYTVEYHVERHYRDGKTLEALDGGSERLRDLLAARRFG